MSNVTIPHFPFNVIDVSKEADASYVCESIDIQSFERKYGKISRGSFVIIYRTSSTQ